MGYSFNIGGEFVKAQRTGINASYKDLAIVCNSVRYTRVANALNVIDRLIAMEMPIQFNRYNKHMGARHELHGRKGAYPIKAAKEVRAVIQNAIANAESKGMSADEMFIVHAAANKTQTIRRQPSKGSLAWGRGMYGRSSIMHSDIELAKVEIILGNGTEETLSHNMKYFLKKKDTKPIIKKDTKKAPVKKMPKSVDATNPAQMQKLAAAIKDNLPKKDTKSEAKTEHSHEGHGHAGHEHEGHTHEHPKVEDKKDTHEHAHEHAHEGHEHQHEGMESK
ncbi:MAG: 50S ribosomal protein L22 [Candidatus Micrarchaeales archaeon]